MLLDYPMIDALNWATKTSYFTAQLGNFPCPNFHVYCPTKAFSFKWMEAI